MTHPIDDAIFGVIDRDSTDISFDPSSWICLHAFKAGVCDTAEASIKTFFSTWRNGRDLPPGTKFAALSLYKACMALLENEDMKERWAEAKKRQKPSKASLEIVTCDTRQGGATVEPPGSLDVNRPDLEAPTISFSTATSPPTPLHSEASPTSIPPSADFFYPKGEGKGGNRRAHTIVERPSARTSGSHDALGHPLEGTDKCVDYAKAEYQGQLDDTLVHTLNDAAKRARKPRSRLGGCLDPRVVDALGTEGAMSAGRIRSQIEVLNGWYAGTDWQWRLLNNIGFIYAPKALGIPDDCLYLLARITHQYMENKKHTNWVSWSAEYVRQVLGVADNDRERGIASGALHQLIEQKLVEVDCSWKANAGFARPVRPVSKVFLMVFDFIPLHDQRLLKACWRDAVQRSYENMLLEQVKLEIANIRRHRWPNFTEMKAFTDELSHHQHISTLSSLRHLQEVIECDYSHLVSHGVYRRIYGPLQRLPKEFRPLLGLVEVDVGGCHWELMMRSSLNDQDYQRWIAVKQDSLGDPYGPLVTALNVTRDKAKAAAKYLLYDHADKIRSSEMARLKRWLEKEFPDALKWIRGVHARTRYSNGESRMTRALETMEQESVVSAIRTLTSEGIVALNLHDGILTTPEHVQRVSEVLQGAFQVKGIFVEVKSK